ncbi:MAG TPA: SDR family NAD(P)-dependent oxidoreductase [Longimicrobiales bacterium]|nr:SDR family NAD(P)-dependent oxidoreductase [Longimicrobiales bacterium]
MNRRDRLGWLTATAIAGAALGVTLVVGAALLLYAAGGFLTTAGFLIAATLGALAAGLWAGGPDPDDDPGTLARRRWAVAVAALFAAALYAPFWNASATLRGSGFGRIVAVLLLLAEPAYAVGGLFVVLNLRPGGRGGAAVPAVLGAALGILAGSALLIPKAEAGTVLAATAGVLALAGVWETRARGSEERSGAMQGRVAVVTGVGARGQVGYAVAEALLAAGARVVVAGHSDAIEEHGRALAEKGGEVAAVRADLTEPEGAMTVVGVARQAFGRLDLLVNVAGGLGVIKPLADTSADEWDREVDRNAKTAFLVSRAALPLLRESHGAIVNFTSPAGLRAKASLGAYSAAKAAVIALTRAMALEEAPNRVRVNAIAPGLIDTEQNRAAVRDPARTKWVTREQIADVVLFLASPQGSGITGETIHVMGEGVE